MKVEFNVYAATSLSIGLLSVVVYASSASGTVGGGDSGELLAVAKEFGVAHPPGYPLWVVCTWLLDAAGLGMTLLSPIAGGMAVGATHNAALVATDCHCAGLLAAGVLVLSPCLWRYAVTPEVFALNSLLCAVLLNLGTRYCVREEERKQCLYLSALVSGLALCNQHTAVVFIVPAALCIVSHFVWSDDATRSERAMVLLKSTVCLAVGLAFYVQIPLSSWLINSKNSWGAAGEWQGFVTHVLREEYGTFSLANQKASYAQTHFVDSIADWAVHLYGQVSPLPLLLAVVGFMPERSYLYSGFNAVRGLLLLLLVVYLVFFAALGNLPLDTAIFRSVQERFYMQPLLIVALASALGLSAVVEEAQTAVDRMLRRRARRGSMPPPPATRPGVMVPPPQEPWAFDVDLVASAVVLTWITAGALALWTDMEQTDNLLVQDFGRAVLSPLDEGCILLTRGDIITNSVRFVQTVQGFRPDCTVLDVEMLRSDWYVPRVRPHHPEVVFPGESYSPSAGGFSALRFLTSNARKSIYVAYSLVTGDKSWMNVYGRLPVGVADLFVPVGELKTWPSHLHKRYLSAVSRAYPAELERTMVVVGNATDPWDQIVVQDYWASLFRIGDFLLTKAAELRGLGGRQPTAAELLDEAVSVLSHVVERSENRSSAYVFALAARGLANAAMGRLQAPRGKGSDTSAADVARAVKALQKFCAHAEHQPDKFGAADLQQAKAQLKELKALKAR
ncbi:Transmembrane protein 260-like protein [Diplonema papillatum]|nr:Transmembrane protein 260-like protein [Diplonema papillatum]